MKQRTDLRILKTHKALITAFFQLLEKKCFEDITVKELCDVALVRRATFYKHFADKYDFGIFVIRQVQAEFYAGAHLSSKGIRSKAFYLDVLRQTISFISQNENLILSILQSNMSTSLSDILSEEISLNLQLKFKEDQSNGVDLPASPELLAQFFTGSIIQSLRWWIVQKNRISEEEFFEQLTQIIRIL